MSEARSSKNSNFAAEKALVDKAAIAHLPNSEKIYITGSRADIQVPMRKISQSETPTDMGGEENPPIFVYDTSGPYTDPNAKIDIRKGLAPLRQKWIEDREDTDYLSGPTSEYGQERLADEKLAALRFDLTRQPRKAKQASWMATTSY